MRHALAASLALLVAPIARAATPLPAPSGVTFTAALGGGSEVGRSASTGVGELELGAGWEAGAVRPEVAVLLGLAPGTYLALRPGVHVAIEDTPFYARLALDVSHAGGSWRSRWLLAGGGAELQLTSVLGAFAEVDLGIPLVTTAGVPVLGRAGFTFRF